MREHVSAELIAQCWILYLHGQLSSIVRHSMVDLCVNATKPPISNTFGCWCN
jgi:hypothetical protein